MPTDEFLLAEVWEVLVRRHARADRVVVGGDILKALIAHAARDQFLGFLNGLNQLTGRQAKLLGAKAWRRLRLRGGHDGGEKDGEQARVDRLLHGGILSPIGA